ncbi:hypothetical protein [Mycolicibacterium bacteremicum]|uniref:hypothetical protein n=1 Tax=Mycolicibacterium bacteremicum TaxID=564198 RepID=UPI0026F0437F|nr:hypothetical protein [Mycolicibacterium bacteremicum]
MSFWLEYGSNEARPLVAFADELAITPAGRPGICFGPLNAPTTMLEPLYRQARANGEAIVEPHGYLLDREPHTARSRNHYPWLAETPRPDTQAEWERWMQRGLDHQLSERLCGNVGPPSFIITPSPMLDAVRADELNTVLDAATSVRSRVAGHDCWLGVTVDRAYLREDRHLTRLLNAVLQTGADGIVFRAPHLQLPPVDDRLYLDGLREVVETCAANGIRAFFPSSGWLGWLAMGWGAWGFSAGMAAGSWVDRIPGPMTRPPQPSLPYFEPQLLRAVPWRIHEQLVSESGYEPCSCVECVQMGGSYDLALAKRHQIRHASEETAALTAVPVTDRGRVVANRIDEAISFRDGLSAVAAARIPTNHLDRWRARL